MTLFLQSAATRKVHTVVGLLSCPSLFGESEGLSRRDDEPTAPAAPLDDPAAPTVLIVGGGPAGCAAARQVRRLRPRAVIHVWEASEALGGGGGLRAAAAPDDRWFELGAQALSFNGQNREAARALAALLGDGVDLRHVDDGLLSFGALSRTAERPQGWNPTSGQWEHFSVPPRAGGSRGFLASLLRAAAPVNLCLGVTAARVARDEPARGWRARGVRRDGGGAVDVIADAVILAVPPHALLELLDGSTDADAEAALAVARAAPKARDASSSSLLGFARGRVADALERKFTHGAREISFDDGAGKVTLVAMPTAARADGAPFDGGAGEAVLLVRVAEARAPPDVLAWLSRWISAPVEEVAAALAWQHAANALQQAASPPLGVARREAPDTTRIGAGFALCGDWVVGGCTVDAALVSGIAAASDVDRWASGSSAGVGQSD